MPFVNKVLGVELTDADSAIFLMWGVTQSQQVS